MLAVTIDLQHSYCNIVFRIIQFKLYLYIFVPPEKVLFLIIDFQRKYYFKRRTTLPNL